MGKINSKQKGKRGELEFTHECKKYGFDDVYRTAQFNGKTEDSLGDCEGLEDIHVEVKRVESLNIDKAMEQAVRDTEVKKERKLPAVFHRKNNKQWKCTMYFSDWVKLYKSWLKDKDKEL